MDETLTDRPERILAGYDIALRLLVQPYIQMLSDAKWYLEQAEEHEANKSVHAVKRAVRSTIILSLAAVESFVNDEAHKYVENNPDLDRATVDYLTEKQTLLEGGRLTTKQRYLSLTDEKLGGWTRVMTGDNFDKGDVIWQKFKEIVEIRDGLIHCKPSNDMEYFYGKCNIETARLGVSSAKAIIARFYGILGEETPEWVAGPYLKD